LPLQSRSAASVDAILEATIQVLLAVGKEQLTTTKVAARAGVSVGTLYQYFPNKSSLLQSVLKQHFAHVLDAVETVCEQQKGASLRSMATNLIIAFLDAKMRDGKSSIAFYSVSSDVDGAELARQIGIRANRAIAAMLATSCQPLNADPAVVASILQGAMSGVSRRILESADPEQQFKTLRDEMIQMGCAYLDTCTVRLAAQDGNEIFSLRQ
jgi:AcrR family transcriptional regulator